MIKWKKFDLSILDANVKDEFDFYQTSKWKIGSALKIWESEGVWAFVERHSQGKKLHFIFSRDQLSQGTLQAYIWIYLTFHRHQCHTELMCKGKKGLAEENFRNP